MATMLKLAAINSINQPKPSSFYEDSKTNPVYKAMEQETNDFIDVVKKCLHLKEANSRPAQDLFALWNKFEPRLPPIYYKKKLLDMGEFLMTLREYRLASWQCFERYLIPFGGLSIDKMTDSKLFTETYFADGYETEESGLTMRALMGKMTCTYQIILLGDPKLQNIDNREKGLKLLKLLQTLTQAVLPQNKLCWIVYNGTIHIYGIARHLMTIGLSAKVIEYLLWSCVCMETSIPLLSVAYLKWRSTLYTAVCQCYYDCRTGYHAEAFAKRALTKINELSQLENMSSDQHSLEDERSFRYATVKMAIMVYKEMIFSTRKKPKGLLRPKARANLKEVQQNPWPRTICEKLLNDMFEGNSGQLLCIIETLHDNNRRTILHCPPGGEQENEIWDIYAELFLAGMEILKTPCTNSKMVNDLEKNIGEMNGIQNEKSLIELAELGENGATIESAYKLTVYAYNYEQWETYDFLLPNLRKVLKEYEDCDIAKRLSKQVDIIEAIDRVLPRNRPKKFITSGGDNDADDLLANTATLSSGYGAKIDDLLYLADVLLSVVTMNFDKQNFDIDMVIDSCLILWKQCKRVFQRYQTGSNDNCKYLQRMTNPAKWIYILQIVNKILAWSGLNKVDPALSAEVVLRLALVLEANASQKFHEELQDGDDESLLAASQLSEAAVTITVDGNVSKMMKTPSILDNTVRNQLTQARDILELGLENVSTARRMIALPDGLSIVDLTRFSKNNDRNESAVWNTVKDLHVELMNIFYRICVKLNFLDNSTPAEKRKSLSQKSFLSRLNETLLVECHDYSLAKALTFAHVAVINFKTINISKQWLINLLNEARKYIEIYEREEKKFWMDNNSLLKLNNNNNKNKWKIPPAPILVSRTDKSFIFKPASWSNCDTNTVCYYAIFGRMVNNYTSSVGNNNNNVKARLSDNRLNGTGQIIPATVDCQLRIDGLQPFCKYVFAVGAYSANGKLIGNGIGETTNPIVAAHPIPILAVWSYLCQAAYEIEHNELARYCCSVLWNYFIADKAAHMDDTYIEKDEKDLSLTVYKLNRDILRQTSPVLLRQFQNCLFIDVDTTVNDFKLHCDELGSVGLLSVNQKRRINCCERMMVSLELAGWLNDTSQAIQATIQCYGLLAPVLQYKIIADYIVEILKISHSVLCFTATTIASKPKNLSSYKHMVAVITYNLAKNLRKKGNRNLASSVNDVGRKILNIFQKGATDLDKQQDEETNKDTEQITGLEETDEKNNDKDDSTSGTTVFKKKLIPNRLRTTLKNRQGNDDMDMLGNEELKALEAHMSYLQRQKETDHELYGNEDISILYAFIAYLPSKLSYKQVCKFRRRARFLEFFVLVAQKSLNEGYVEQSLNWCEEMQQFIVKRNEQFTSNERNASNPAAKTWNAAVTEITKTEETVTNIPKLTNRGNKKVRYKAIGIPTNLPENQRLIKEQEQFKAFDKFGKHLPYIWSNYVRKKRLRKICFDEMPWRSEINHIQGKCILQVILEKFDLALKSFNDDLNMDLFSFEHLGQMLITDDEKYFSNLRLPIQRNYQASSIDLAAAVASSGKLTAAGDLFGLDDDKSASIFNKEYVEESVKTAYDFFRRSIVLAHRGQHFVLLQNVVRSVWNYTTLLFRYWPTLMKCLKVVKTFFTAADCLLDMWTRIRPVKCEQLDCNFIKKVTMNTLQQLFYVEKWEWIVDLSLRYSALTNNQHALDIKPIMLCAQYQLIYRIKEYGGPNVPQLHYANYSPNEFQYLEQECQKFALKLPKVYRQGKETQLQLAPGAKIDPVGHDLYSGGLLAKRLCCVPLDVEQTRQSLIEAFNNTNYTAISLKHSRRLLNLFIVGRLLKVDEERAKSSDSKVAFSKQAFIPPILNPPNYETITFKDRSDIVCCPLALSHIELVRESYKRTVQLLLANKSKRNNLHLVGQALREFGCFELLNNNKKITLKLWNQAIDVMSGYDDFLKNWTNIFSIKNDEDLSETLLKKYDLSICLLMASLISNLAQYIPPTELNRQTDYCLLASYFFKTVFRSTLPHPKSDRDYATYEIGCGEIIENLIPNGFLILSNRNATNAANFVDGLNFAIKVLANSSYLLKVLPLMTLHNYLTTYILPNIKSCVAIRLHKVEVLTDLRYFSEAIYHLMKILYGENIPDYNGMKIFEMTSTTKRFQNGSKLQNDDNLKFLDLLMDKRLAPNQSSIYGSYLTCRINIIQARLIIELASTIDSLPIFEYEQAPGTNLVIKPSSFTNLTASPQNSTAQPSSTANLNVNTSSRKKSIKISVPSRQSIRPCESFMDNERVILKRLANKKMQGESLTDGHIKGILLMKADGILTSISEMILEKSVIERGINYLNHEELEIAVACKLELSKISRQRHHSIFASQLVYYAMDMISCNKLLQNDVNELIDKRIWLKARLELLKSRCCQIKGMGMVKGESSNVTCQLATAREYCAIGIAEAENWCEAYYQAEFLWQSVILDSIEGIEPQNTLQSLDEIINLCKATKEFSSNIERLKLSAICHSTDIKLALNKISREDAFKLYLNAHTELLNNIKLVYGQHLLHRMPKPNRDEFSTLTEPLSNIFIHDLQLLIAFKHRIGHCQINLMDSLCILKKALDLSNQSCFPDLTVQCEILLEISQIEYKLFLKNEYDSQTVKQSLINVITLTYQHDHDLSRMRQAYLNLIRIYAIDCKLLKTDNNVQRKKVIRLNVLSKGKKSVNVKEVKDSVSTSDIDSYESDMKAWLALKCSSMVGQALRRRIQISADDSLVSAAIPADVRLNMPQFAYLDLVANYVLGEKKRVYKNDIEKEMAPLTEALEPPIIETYDDQLQSAQKATEGLSWVHLIGYQQLIQRLATTDSLFISSNGGYAPVKSILFGGHWRQRIVELHRFMNSNLAAYADGCIAPVPMDTTLFKSADKLQLFGQLCVFNEKDFLLMKGTQRKNYKELCAILIDNQQFSLLNNKLNNIIQKSQLLLVEKKSAQASARKDSKKISPKKEKFKAVSAEAIAKDRQELEELLQSSVTDIQTLIGSNENEESVSDSVALTETTSAVAQTVTELPFEMNRNNINMLERIFNPNFGYVLKDKQLLNWFLKILT